MFLQVPIRKEEGKTRLALVNVDHIVYAEEDRTSGSCILTLSTGRRVSFPISYKKVVSAVAHLVRDVQE